MIKKSFVLRTSSPDGWYSTTIGRQSATIWAIPQGCLANIYIYMWYVEEEVRVQNLDTKGEHIYYFFVA
jgi:hypothetical protein